MASAWFRFYEELNDFLPPAQRKVEFEHRFDRRASIKDMIESLGVPHPEIELILVNSRSVDFSHIVSDGDHISVYPVFESLDVSPLLRLRPEPLRNPGFIVDSNLGRLARYLRLLGFDCLYRNDYRDIEVARISLQQHRTVLTRDRRLLQYKVIDHGLFIRSTAPKDQVREILKRLDLYRLARPFSRCTRCNGVLAAVSKESVDRSLQPRTRRYYHVFRQCPDCKQVYWQGSHHARMLKLIGDFIATPSGSEETESVDS